MRAGSDSDVLTKTWRQGPAILLAALITSRGAAPQAVPGDSPATAVDSSSSVTAAQSRESPLPTNLIVPDVVLPLVLSMWRVSPTFRRQCARIVEHAEVIVRLDLLRERDGRARSRVKRHDAGLNVAVQIDSYPHPLCGAHRARSRACDGAPGRYRPPSDGTSAGRRRREYGRCLRDARARRRWGEGSLMR